MLKKFHAVNCGLKSFDNNTSHITIHQLQTQSMMIVVAIENVLGAQRQR